MLLQSGRIIKTVISYLDKVIWIENRIKRHTDFRRKLINQTKLWKKKKEQRIPIKMELSISSLFKRTMS